MKRNALILSMLTCLPLLANAEELKIQFSREDIDVLRELSQIDEVSTIGAKFILSVPVISLLSSTSPTEIIVSVLTLDINQMNEAAKNMKRLGACKITALLEEHLNSYTNDNPPRGAAKRYFQKLNQVYSGKC